MDSNGYNKSLLNTEAGVCYICHCEVDTARHEVFGGNGTRAISKRYGLWVNLCPMCHEYIHRNPSSEKAAELRADAERAFIAAGHTPADFTDLFVIGNKKHWEIEDG